jgi:type I restriction enzyme R subunit
LVKLVTFILVELVNLILTLTSTRDDIKANLQVDLILLLDEFDYPPVTIDDVYKEVLEQAENFKKYSE